MTILDDDDALTELCRATKRWGMLISFDPDDHAEVMKAAPFLNIETAAQVLCDGFGILLFDSEEECRTTYSETVGDDGPTVTNPYDGPARVYALTCGPDGEFRQENT